MGGLVVERCVNQAHELIVGVDDTVTVAVEAS
jgi:hypothetical protein